MLYIIGIGLNDERDISLRSLDILKKADLVYLEAYTCIQSDSSRLESLIQKRVILADRKMVEERNEIVEEAENKIVAFLVSGTPFFATTHSDIFMRAKERSVEIRVIHNISILNVKGCYGLYSYNFGRTVSIPYFTSTWKPTSFYENICLNIANKMHTLCLLDIKTDENRFMTANEAIEQLLYSEKELNRGCFSLETELIAVCRFATDSERAVFGKAKELKAMDFGGPLHSLIIPGSLSVIERELLEAGICE